MEKMSTTKDPFYEKNKYPPKYFEIAWRSASCLFSKFSHVELFSSKNQQHKTSITSFLNNSLHAMQHSKVTCSIRKQYFEKVLLTSPPLNYDLKAQKY